MVESSTRDNITTITLRPNRSSTWAQTRIFIAFLCATTLAVGVFWTMLGAWVILPFSGLEALIIILLFHRVSYDTYQRQVITLGEKDIRIQSGVHYPKRTWMLHRDSTSILVREPEKPMDNVDLRITDRDLNLPLGLFLNKEDRYETLKLLRASGLRIRRRIGN